MNPLVTEVGVFTATLTTLFVIPAGARTIDLNNKGGNTASYKGNTLKLNGVSNGFVDLAAGQAYSFGDVNKPYPEITINAVGTQVDVSITY